MVTVRVAVREDDPAVAAVAEAAFASVRRIYRPTAAARAAPVASGAPQVRLVAERDGVIVGTVRYALPDDRRVHLVGMAVHPAHQRTGVARALVEHAADIARATGRSALSLNTVRETGNVARFERLGFRALREAPDDRVESDIYPQLIDVYMKRLLSTHAAGG